MKMSIGSLMLALMLTLAVMIHSSAKNVAAILIVTISILTGVITSVLLTLALVNIRRSSGMNDVIKLK